MLPLVNHRLLSVFFLLCSFLSSTSRGKSLWPHDLAKWKLADSHLVCVCVSVEHAGSSWHVICPHICPACVADYDPFFSKAFSLSNESLADLCIHSFCPPELHLLKHHLWLVFLRCSDERWSMSVGILWCVPVTLVKCDVLHFHFGSANIAKTARLWTFKCTKVFLEDRYWLCPTTSTTM